MNAATRAAMKDLLPWLLMTALTVSWMIDLDTPTPPAVPPAEAVAMTTTPAADTGQVFQLADLVAQLEASERAYLPFLTVPTLRTGLYALPAGGVDRQQPHGQDEVYYVIKGRAGITIDGEAHPLVPGAVIFVAAQAEHRFHDIEEDVLLLVFFSEAEPEAAEE